MKRFIILAVVAALTVAAPAYAASSVTDTYGGTAHNVLGAVSNGGNGNSGGNTAPVAQVQQVPQAKSGSTLPFTGLDIGLLAVGGCLLMGVGVVLRRVAARPLS
jgi:hypothetical protein